MPRAAGALLLGLALLVLVAVIVLPSSPKAFGGTTVSAEAAATPRLRFQQLVDLVSAAVDRGNTATARELSQQALTTFEQIPPDERDVDSRYHAAMLRAVAGDGAGALADADSILATAPGNLLGYYVRGVVARLRKDSIGARTADADFTARYRVEMAKARPEYIEHRQLLEAFLRQP
jgi:hypothetical protein